MSIVSTLLLLYLVTNVIVQVFGEALAQISKTIRVSVATRSLSVLVGLIPLLIVIGLAYAILSEYYHILLPTTGTTYVSISLFGRVAEWIREQINAAISP